MMSFVNVLRDVASGFRPQGRLPEAAALGSSEDDNNNFFGFARQVLYFANPRYGGVRRDEWWPISKETVLLAVVAIFFWNPTALTRRVKSGLDDAMTLSALPGAERQATLHQRNARKRNYYLTLSRQPSGEATPGEGRSDKQNQSGALARFKTHS
jgi:hypothetical protein